MRKICFLALLILFSCYKDDTPRFILSISSSVGGAVDLSGGEYSEGKSVTITATANAEYQFVNWSNGSTQNPLTVTVMSDQVLSANFQKVKYGLIIATQGEGSVTEELISLGRTSDYNSGSLVRLTAAPATGYSFTGWTGDVISTSNPLEVDITSAKNITAIFDLIVVSLFVETEDGGGVFQEVVGADRSTNYNYGETIKLTAQPGEGFDFISWSGDIGDLDPKQNPLEITLTESRTIKANFDYELFNRIVGKWKIRKKTSDSRSLTDYDVSSIVFNIDYSFELVYSEGQIAGTFDVISNTEIELIDIGSFSDMFIYESESETAISFNINIPGVIEYEVGGEDLPFYSPGRTWIPHSRFEQALIDLGLDDVRDDYVTTANIVNVKTLDLSPFPPVYELRGIEGFRALEILILDNSRIEELDLFSNRLLQILYISNGSLKPNKLNISNNSALNTLVLDGNTDLGSINISSNSNLENLSLQGNAFSTLDISNNLLLKTLVLNNNNFNSIDFSNNTELISLIIDNNNLSSLDLSNSTNLTNLIADNNELTSIDLSSNDNLTNLLLNSNQLSSIDISNNQDLLTVGLNNNQISTLDISNNLSLENLLIGQNTLLEIDLSNNTSLINFESIGNTSLTCVLVNSDQLANIPSTWTKDDATEFTTDCTPCLISGELTNGALTQTTTIGTLVTPTEITLSSTCSDTTYTMSYVDNSVPGLIVSFTDSTINLSGAPSTEGTYDYSILVESTNLTYNQIYSTTLSGTITSNAPSLSTTLTSGPQSQTVTATTSIAQVQYTYSTNYTGPINASASNLPPGISLSFSNNVATLSGTATTSGTYNYSITVSVGSTNQTVQGTITVNEAPQYGSSAVDQYNATGGWGAGGSSQWQSFTVGVKGKLTAVQWLMSNPVSGSTEGQDVTFKVYSGEGDGGTLLATSSGLTTPPDKDENGNWAPHEYVSFDVSSYNILVDVNEVYTMKISIGAQDVGFLNLNLNNVYTRGRGSHAGNANSDYLFKTFVSPQTN